MTKPIEDLIYDFLDPVLTAAQSDNEDPLFGVTLHDTVYRPIDNESDCYVQIGGCDSNLAPNAGATEMLEFDGDVTLICLVRVTGADRRDREAARTRVVEITKAVAKQFLDDPTMGTRVNDSRILKCPRDWTSINSTPFALTNVPMIVNET
jgi:hypothetical protein